METVIEYRAVLISGTQITILLAILSLLLSILCGLGGAYLKMSSSLILQRVGNAYTTLIRSVPELVLMMLIFYGGQVALNDLGAVTGLWDYIEVNQFVAGVLTLGFITTEFLRGSIETIPAGEIEAAKACGLTPFARMRLVVLPSAFRRALPAYSNEVIFTLHGSAIASLVTLQDLLGAGRWLNGRYYLAYEGFVTAMLFYMFIVFIITRIFRLAEKRYLAHLRPRETTDVPALVAQP